MKRHADVRRLRRLTALFFLALAIPSGVLVWQSYSRLKWETFHQHQRLAEELARRIDERIASLVAVESARQFTDYGFLTVAGAPTSNFVQRSVLAAFPVSNAVPGLMGYFQVDPRGDFSTPLLPDAGTDATSVGITPEEFMQRQGLARRIHAVLSANELLAIQRSAVPVVVELAATVERDADLPAPATATEYAVGEREVAAPAGQAAFDRLNDAASGDDTEKKIGTSALGRVEDLKLDQRYQAKTEIAASRSSPAKRDKQASRNALRKEQNVLPDLAGSKLRQTDPLRETRSARTRVRMFESEVDGFESSLLDSGHLVLYRKVWRNGERIIQGLLIEQGPFLDEIVRSAFQATALSRMSNLIVAYQGALIAAFNGDAERSYRSNPGSLRGTLLYQTRLTSPFSRTELIFSINQLPAGPSGNLLAWTAALLASVVTGGLYLMYRLSLGHIQLGQQQQDFVSAISHELKTPLTSIRMYGEMLREGWAPPEKRPEYYAFIHDESERLSRLINNVLHLARMTRNELAIDMKAVTVSELVDSVRSKIGSSVAHAGAELQISVAVEIRARRVLVDQDCFTQIIINLVDNALKFSAKAANRAIAIDCRAGKRGTLVFAVRDHGPGIAPDQMQKIFQLFYRAENELTRETSGTGIGLALVQRLAQAMGATVDATNMAPGAEFRLHLQESK